MTHKSKYYKYFEKILKHLSYKDVNIDALISRAMYQFQDASEEELTEALNNAGVDKYYNNDKFASEKTAKGDGARSKNRLSEYQDKDDSWILSQIANKEPEPSFKLDGVGKDAKFNDVELATGGNLFVTKKQVKIDERIKKVAGKIEKELVGGALYDFLGYLTSVENKLTDGPKTDATIALNVMFDWIEKRNPELLKAMNSPDYDKMVTNWMKNV